MPECECVCRCLFVFVCTGNKTWYTWRLWSLKKIYLIFQAAWSKYVCFILLDLPAQCYAFFLLNDEGLLQNSLANIKRFSVNCMKCMVSHSTMMTTHGQYVHFHDCGHAIHDHGQSNESPWSWIAQLWSWPWSDGHDHGAMVMTMVRPWSDYFLNTCICTHTS